MSNKVRLFWAGESVESERRLEEEKARRLLKDKLAATGRWVHPPTCGWEVHSRLMGMLGSGYDSDWIMPWFYFLDHPLFSCLLCDIMSFYRGVAAIKKEGTGKLRGVLPYLGFKRFKIRLQFETHDILKVQREAEEFLALVVGSYPGHVRRKVSLTIDVVQAMPEKLMLVPLREGVGG